MTSINTNLSSLIVQKNLTRSTNALNQAVERLTTGFKINHASDNAANYSISESMTSKLSSYFVAEENTSMGLDLIQTQSSTLDTIQNLTTRLRALAEQAHNGTYGAQSLAAINQEAEAIISEIERIGNNAEYNGIKLFDNALSQTDIPQLKSNGLMQEIERRDTSGMTRLADVDANETLAAGTYSITTAEELSKLADIVNAGDSVEDCEFVLGADIDLSEYSNGTGWNIIGERSDRKFKGTFDGNGYTISNLYINKGVATSGGSPMVMGSGPRIGGVLGGRDGNQGGREDLDYEVAAVGLFGYVQEATISNLIMENCYVNVNENAASTDSAGAIVGNLRAATVSNCTVSGSVSVQNESGSAGLIIGTTRGLSISFDTFCGISNCYSTGSVSSKTNSGGIIGSQTIGIIEYCFSDANIGATSENAMAGGLVGSGDCVITNSASTGNVNSDIFAGGIIGYVDNSNAEYNIIDSAFMGKVSSSLGAEYSGVGTMAGGVVSAEQVGLDPEEYAFTFGISGGIYDSAISNGVGAIGYSGTTEITSDAVDVSSKLQVGVDSSDSSMIKFTTNISLSSISSLKFGGMEGANSLERIDNFISKLSDAQTKLGAVENRLMSTLESISVNVENLTSSRSTLKDADVAKESSQLLKNQILQQAAATLLSTANQTPSLTLRLLSGIN